LKVLVTGSAGFFGKAISQRLQLAGHDVVCSDFRVKPDSFVEYLDVSSKESCNSIFLNHKGIEAVVHCAAIVHIKEGVFPGEQYYLTNAKGTKNILDAAVANGAKRFVHISTVSVYGEFDFPSPVKESCPTKPIGYYGTSKKTAEDFCLQREKEVCLYILRMTTMYGRKWLFNIRKKITPPLIGRYFYLTFNGKNGRYSLCSDKNGAEAVLWAIEGKMNAGTYNIADYFDYSLYNILKAVEKYDGKKWHISIPKWASVLILKSLIWLSPTSRLRLKAYSRYWAFFENNLFSVDKLRSAGFNSPPDLIDMAKG
jgi:nucleoside-diphosphate-sugar epimerase